MEIKSLSWLIYFLFSGYGFENALNFFKTYEIDTLTCVENVHELFVTVQNLYNQELRLSIENDIKEGHLPWKGNPTYYNYLIINGTKLYDILENYRNTILPVIVKNEHFELLLKKIGGKFEKIMDIWDKGQGLKQPTMRLMLGNLP